jgi:hypothetical protein
MPIPTSSPPDNTPKRISPSGLARLKPWFWRPLSQTTALSNARGASIDLSRTRVEREEVDIFIARLEEARRLLGRV